MTVDAARAEAVLARHWRGLADETIERSVVGVNRAVFRCGGHWLTAAPTRAAARLERESRLYAALQGQPSARGWEIVVPRPVPAVDGAAVVVDGDIAWRVVTHVPGAAPSPEHFACYPSVGEAVRALHEVLSRVPHDLAVYDRPLAAALDAVADGWRSLAAGELPEAWPGERDDDLLAAAHGALARIGEGVTRAVSRDRQLVHDDVYFPNLLLDLDRRRLGILDCEFSCVDGTVVDLASLAIGALCRSGDPARGLTAFEALAVAYGTPHDLDDLLATALARKVVSYWFHRAGAQRGRPLEVALLQREHLATCIDALEGALA